MAFWNEINYKTASVVMNFGRGINGHNDPLTLEKDEVTDSLNMCADNYPIARVRNDRLISPLPQSTKSLWGVGQRAGNQIHVLEGSDWKYGSFDSTAWTNISTGIVGPGKANFVEFNTQVDKYTILAHSTGVVYNSYWDGSVYSTFSDTNCPRTNIMVSHRYRLYGPDADGRTLKYCAQGDITDWTTADDAGYLDITSAKGKIVAGANYADHPILWTDNSMHELYGTAVDNFELVNVSHNVGCVSRNAYAECNGKLFWLDYSGVYLYTGGLPRRVVHRCESIIDGINWDHKDLIYAGSVDSKVYFAIPYKSTANNRILVIDLIEGRGEGAYAVNLEDGDWLGFLNNGESMYGMSNTGYLWNMHSTELTGLDNSTAIPWHLETRPYTAEMNQEMAVRDIYVEYQSTGSINLSYTTQDNSTTYLDIAVSTDFGAYVDTRRKQIWPASSQLQGHKFMKFRLYGDGQKKVSGLLLNTVSYGSVI